jgi:alpha-beta hydrolase superfamily lysophospholipase
MSVRGTACALHRWTPGSTPRAVVVLYHGLGAHAQFPTVRHAAELLSEHGFAVLALDMPGHGASAGERGLLASAGAVEDIGLLVARHAADAHPSLPLFLMGSSMGGAIALAVSRRSPGVAGVVLLAPMLMLDTPLWLGYVLALAACLAPSLAAIPSSATSASRQYRDLDRRWECEEDPLSYKGKLRLASASACVELAARTCVCMHRALPQAHATSQDKIEADKPAFAKHCHRLRARRPPHPAHSS